MTDEVKKENISVPKKEWDEMKDAVDRLKRGEMPTFDNKYDNERYVFVRMIDGNPVIKWDTEMKQGRNVKGELTDLITVYTKGDKGEDKIEMEYLEFIRNTEKVKAKIIKEDVKTRVTLQGYTTKKYVKEYKTIDTGVRIPIKVETPDVTFLLELPNGKEISINGLYLN